MLAFLAQLTLVLAGVSEGRAGLGYAAHVDAGGTATHYSHDEAVCAACQARSLHGVVRPAPASIITPRPRETATVTWRESYRDSSVNFQNLSRAPPFVS